MKKEDIAGDGGRPCISDFGDFHVVVFLLELKVSMVMVCCELQFHDPRSHDESHSKLCTTSQTHRCQSEDEVGFLLIPEKVTLLEKQHFRPTTAICMDCSTRIAIVQVQ